MSEDEFAEMVYAVHEEFGGEVGAMAIAIAQLRIECAKLEAIRDRISPLAGVVVDAAAYMPKV